MNIIEKSYTWNGSLTKRCLTNYIILHHRGGNGDVQSIHEYHVKDKGWVGIGYHFYIRKDGSVYRGRPIDMWGAHTVGYNDKSVAVCFEGNFETDKMTPTQLKAGQELITYLKTLYPKAEVLRHKDFESTACPGKNFPFAEMLKGEKIMTVDEAIEILMNKVGLEEQTIDFLLCYKYGEELVVKLAKGMK